MSESGASVVPRGLAPSKTKDAWAGGDIAATHTRHATQGLSYKHVPLYLWCSAAPLTLCLYPRTESLLLTHKKVL